MPSVHAFRTLILDDQWRDALFSGSSHISLLLDTLFAARTTLTYKRGESTPNRLAIALKKPGTIRAGLIRGNYPVDCLELTDHGLRWGYGADSWPLGIEWAGSEPGGTQICKWHTAAVPAGFYVGTELKGEDVGTGYQGRHEVFVLSFWPFDHLDDLIGARAHISRFWNLLILDNLIYRNELEGCQLTVDPGAPDPFGDQKQLYLFGHFRHPVSDPNRDALWDPDRRTQAMIEASQETNWATPISGRKLWPRFQLDKTLAAKGRLDEAVKEFQTYQQCIDRSPSDLAWKDFVASVAKLAGTVKRWHSPPIDSLTDPDGIVARVAATDYPVFFIGAPGTGKSHLANAIHLMSSRVDKKFQEVNCGAIPREGNFFESTVFGMEAGALGEGTSEQKGILREADGGTVFMDEVHHLPERLQAALLTFLENGKLRPLGGSDAAADVRIIVATNERKVIERAYADPEHSKLRPDFLQRVAFHSIQLSLLSERPEPEFIAICENVFANVKNQLSSERGLPLAHVDPVVNEHIKAIRIDRSVFHDLYRKIQDEPQWKRQFDVGGNVRFLKQLLTKAVIRQWVQEEITLRHIEQAFEIEKLRFVEEPASALQREDGGASVAKALSALTAASEALTGSFEEKDAATDSQAALGLLSLWQMPAKLFETAPLFVEWAERPHLVDLKGQKLPPLKERSRQKWQVVVVFSFLRFLKARDIRRWQTKERVDDRISAIFSDRQFSDTGPMMYVDKVFAQLGYTKRTGESAGKQSQLPNLMLLWETEESKKAGFRFEAGAGAKKEYVDALVAALRNLPT